MAPEDKAACMNIGHWELERRAFELRHAGEATRCTPGAPVVRRPVLQRPPAAVLEQPEVASRQVSQSPQITGQITVAAREANRR